LEGISSSFSGMQRFNLLMQVFDVGRNEVVEKTKEIEGCTVKPRIGSSSAPVTNCKILFNVTLPLRPPTT
jgi:hypothetical protein